MSLPTIAVATLVLFIVGGLGPVEGRLPDTICSIREEVQNLATEAYREANPAWSGYEVSVLSSEPTGGFPDNVGPYTYDGGRQKSKVRYIESPNLCVGSIRICARSLIRLIRKPE